MLQVSHCIHQTIGENHTKPLNCVECGCMRKGKVVAVHAMEAYGAVEVYFDSFYTSELAGGKWLARSHSSMHS